MSGSVNVKTAGGTTMSGEPITNARDCLKGEEIDPQGVATPCVTPTVSVAPAPPVVIPRVGGESWGVAFVLAMIILLVYVKMGGKR